MDAKRWKSLFFLTLLIIQFCFGFNGLSPHLKFSRPQIIGRITALFATDYRQGSEERRQQSLRQGHNPLISLNLNLDSLAQSAAGPRAQELLERINALYKDGYYEVSPDTVSFNSVLKVRCDTKEL